MIERSTKDRIWDGVTRRMASNPEDIALSREVLRESTFPQMLDLLALDMDGRVADGVLTSEKINRHWPYGVSGAILNFIWDEEFVVDEPSIANAFSIEALPEGSIIVHGGEVGSTVLLRGEWKNKELREDAIRKAIKFPAFVKIFSRSGEYSLEVFSD